MQNWRAHRALLAWQCQQVCQHPLNGIVAVYVAFSVAALIQTMLNGW